jgi:galactokinase
MIHVGEFQRHFGSAPRVVAASPGRVNLLGEHIDYLGGKVMPAAINRHLVIEASPTDDGSFEIVPPGAGFGSPVRFGRHERYRREEKAERWLNYLLGVVAGYEAAGVAVPGFRAVIHADLPAGAGLSASAAFETATALVVEALTGAERTIVERALLCQRAEHEYAGVPCGIMDQFAVGAGKAGHALLLDCHDLTTRLVPLPEDLVLLITDTGVKHALGDGEYRLRREQCEAALAILGADSFRNLTPDEVEAQRGRLGDLLYRRARHAVSEMERVEAFARALEDRNDAAIGRLLGEGHRSLRDDYEVSCDELDCLVEAADAIGPENGHLGTRMTGGGFGGSAISVVKRGAEEAVRVRLQDAFERRFGRRPAAFVTGAVEGARRIP